MRILFVSYLWPPDRNPAAIVGFRRAKSLAYNGMRVDVITANRSAASVPEMDVTIVPDPLHRDTPSPSVGGYKRTILKRVTTAVKESLVIPDDKVVAWIWRVKAVVAQVAKDYDALYLEGPPFSTFLLSNTFNRVLPTILEFQDYWSVSKGVQKKALFARAIEKSLERWTANGSSLVVTVGDTMTSLLSQDISPPVVTAYIGLDDAVTSLCGTQELREKCIVYAGQVNEVNYVPIAFPFLREFFRLHPDWRLKHVGGIADSVAVQWNREVQRYDLRRFIDRLGPRGFDETTGHIRRATLALLALREDHPINRQVLTSTKLFDYAAMRTPVLAFVPLDSDAFRLVTNYHLGMTMSSFDVSPVKVPFRWTFDDSHMVSLGSARIGKELVESIRQIVGSRNGRLGL